MPSAIILLCNVNHCLNNIGLEVTLHLVHLAMAISFDINLKPAQPRDASTPSTADLLVGGGGLIEKFAFTHLQKVTMITRTKEQ